MKLKHLVFVSCEKVQSYKKRKETQVQDYGRELEFSRVCYKITSRHVVYAQSYVVTLTASSFILIATLYTLAIDF